MSKVRKVSRDVPAYEFGGPWGVLFILVSSHILLYYVYFILHHNNGALWFPASTLELQTALKVLVQSTAPSWHAAGLYFAYLAVEAVFVYILPGPDLKGRPDDKGDVLTYRCNAYAAWWATLAIMAWLHFTGVFQLSQYVEQAGPVMTVAILWGDALSLFLYVQAFATGATHRMTGNHVYDFFMGAVLHPRVGILDIKLVAELRVSWFLLFINTASCAAKQYEDTGHVTPSMAFMVLAHFLYANACAKGEHYIPPTWDIFYEKFGWMLCFWNFAGVPFLYCAQPMYLLRHGDGGVKPLFVLAVTVALLAAYYVWDTSQSQKNHFRLQYAGVHVDRVTFPYLPWQTIDKPRHIKTERGTPLLVDGWWQYARKIHYTCDIVMALSWGLVCGFDCFIPYFYVCFFTVMIVHRYNRDMARCSRHYGKDWVTYCKTVPYSFIPGLI